MRLLFCSFKSSFCWTSSFNFSQIFSLNYFISSKFSIIFNHKYFFHIKNSEFFSKNSHRKNSQFSFITKKIAFIVLSCARSSMLCRMSGSHRFCSQQRKFFSHKKYYFFALLWVAMWGEPAHAHKLIFFFFLQSVSPTHKTICWGVERVEIQIFFICLFAPRSLTLRLSADFLAIEKIIRLFLVDCNWFFLLLWLVPSFFGNTEIMIGENMDFIDWFVCLLLLGFFLLASFFINLNEF